MSDATMVETKHRTPTSSLKMPTSSFTTLKSAEEKLSDDSPAGIAKPSTSDTAAAFQLSDDTTPSHMKPPPENKLSSNMFKFDTDSKSASVGNLKSDGDGSDAEDVSVYGAAAAAEEEEVPPPAQKKQKTKQPSLTFFFGKGKKS